MNLQQKIVKLENKAQRARSTAEFQGRRGISSLLITLGAFGVGAWLTDKTLNYLDMAEKTSGTMRAIALASGGLIISALTLEKTYRSRGSHPLQLVGWWRNLSEAKKIESKKAKLARFIPKDLTAGEEAQIIEFAAWLDTTWGTFSGPNN